MIPQKGCHAEFYHCLFLTHFAKLPAISDASLSELEPELELVESSPPEDPDEESPEESATVCPVSNSSKQLSSHVRNATGLRLLPLSLRAFRLTPHASGGFTAYNRQYLHQGKLVPFGTHASGGCSAVKQRLQNSVAILFGV